MNETFRSQIKLRKG